MPARSRRLCSMDRYDRQKLLLGEEKQKILQGKTAAVVGVGALGTVAAELLARAGVSLLLIDRDVVEESNLQRQLLFDEQDVGKSKAIAAKEKLSKINSSITIMEKPVQFDNQNIKMLDDVDIVLDCTDNLETRFLVNDHCRKQKIPWIYGAAIKTSGYVMPIVPEGPCLRCFLKEANLETCDTVGVLNTVTTIIAAEQATLALKILLGENVEPILSYHDVWNDEHKKLMITKKAGCPACNGVFEYLDKKDTAVLVRFCSAGKFQIRGNKPDLGSIKERWSKIGKVYGDGQMICFGSITLFEDGRALVRAKTKEEALSIYSRLVGN